MTKIDYRKELQHLYKGRKGTPTIVDVPPMNFLMVDGQGHPSEQEFQDAVSTIYPVAYTLKFMVRKHDDLDYKVMPLEVKWKINREEKGSKRYGWTVMVMQPEFITKGLFLEAVEQAKLKRALPYEEKLRFTSRTEGLCGQIFHKGPYGDPMEETFELLKQYLAQNGYQGEPDSHDIYLNSVLRTKPENLKTIIRVRVQKDQE